MKPQRPAGLPHLDLLPREECGRRRGRYRVPTRPARGLGNQQRNEH
jgi:hypothetical protein